MLKITSESHTDHLHADHVAWILDTYGDRDSFFIETVELPTHLPPLTCKLYGPSVGDDPVPAVDCRMVERPGRVTRGISWPSRVCDRPPRDTSTITVIAGPDPDNDEPMVLYTAYGGPCAPREPGDPDIPDDSMKARSDAFWVEHALSG